MSSFAAAGDFDRIQRELNQFRLEQEANLLKIGTGHRDKKVLVSPAKLSHNRTIEDKSLEKYFDLDCVILLESSNAKGNYKSLALWPLGLVAYFADKYADLGNAESSGSLWRLQKHESAHSTQNTVILQATEIGEVPMYLSPECELTESVDLAAKWEVHVTLPDEKDITSDTQFDFKGLVVQFALVESDGDGLGTSDGFDTSIATGKDPHSLQRYLVSARSADAGHGIALLSFEQIVASLENGEGIDWSVSWELVSEEACASIAPIAGAEFLDDAAAFAEDGQLF